MQAQAWICPLCFDDHGGRDCKPEDLKAELEKARARAEAAESALAAVRALVTSEQANQYRDEACRGVVALPYASNRYVRLLDDIRAALATPTTPEETQP